MTKANEAGVHQVRAKRAEAVWIQWLSDDGQVVGAQFVFAPGMEQPQSADAVDPHAADLGKPSTREGQSSSSSSSSGALLSAGAVPPQAPYSSVRDLARTLGWGEMSAYAAWNFLYEREQLLRLAQAELETHKSHAATAALAIRDRINALKQQAAGAVPSPHPSDDKASEAEYQSHVPWCPARRFGGVNRAACTCGVKDKTDDELTRGDGP